MSELDRLFDLTQSGFDRIEAKTASIDGHLRESAVARAERPVSQ
jgi:hypothetical protein